MKSFFTSLLAALLLIAGSGCAQLQSRTNQGCQDGCNGACNNCGMLGAKRANAMTAYGDPCGNAAGKQAIRNPRAFTGNPGPPSAAITYPYYTTRGPRDFLLDNPQTIGP